MNSATLFSKKIIKAISPPILLDVYKYLFKFLKRPEDFKIWWNEFPKDNLPRDLVPMVDHFITTPAFKKSSKYWNVLNIRNIQQISNYGYENFKQIVARNYFTWVDGIDTAYSTNLLKNIDKLSIDCPIKEVLKKHVEFTLEESIIHNIVTVLLFDYVCKNGGGKYIQMLEEPLEGNPPFINIREKRVTQDLLNSILEYLAIYRGCEINQCSTILELGAGSGRTSFCMLKLMSEVKYIVVDIPPALYIAQTYLSNVFRDKKIFSFRPFSAFKSIEDEFNSANIIFMMPDQLYLLPDKIIDVFIAIDCLHEMKREAVELYFNHVDRLANYLFFKCWNKTTIPFDDITYASQDYPVKDNWHKVYKSACGVPSTYFEAFYKIL